MERNEEYTEKILDLIREELSCTFPFLTPAIYGLEPEASPGYGFRYAIGRDGDKFLYDPEGLIKDFNEGKDTTGFFLHSVLHCLLLHPYFASLHGNRELWDLSCDICIRDIMCRLGKDGTNDEDRVKEESLLTSLRDRIPALNAEGVYSVLDGSSIPTGLFYIDDHVFWEIQGRKDKESAETEGLEKWHRIAGEVELSVQRSCRNTGGRGDLNGYFLEVIENIGRRHIDYGTFLKRFGSYGEILKTDPDSFDYSFYNYGLELYGDMPLIEPLEYSERKTVREFAVAIDTSLSCSMELIRYFLEMTYDILFMSMEHGERKKMIVFQCDKEIKNETVIQDREELEKYMLRVSVQGRGGRDCRPVFGRIEELKKEKFFSDLKGLLYFTDGDGIFPEVPPKYKTAFVIPYGGDLHKVPPWAAGIGFSV